MALRMADSRIPICAKRANGFCAKIPGKIINGTTATITQNKLPPISQKIPKNRKKNGKSAIAVDCGGQSPVHVRLPVHGFVK